VDWGLTPLSRQGGISPKGEIIIKSLLVMTTPLPPRRDLPQGGDNSLLLIYNTIGYTELSPL